MTWKFESLATWVQPNVSKGFRILLFPYQYPKFLDVGQKLNDQEYQFLSTQEHYKYQFPSHRT